jgi:hypothetical protein
MNTEIFRRRVEARRKNKEIKFEMMIDKIMEELTECKQTYK